MLGRCALRPAVSGGDACEKADDGCAIRGVRRSASTHVSPEHHHPMSIYELSCLEACDVDPEHT